jgi:hypothetical protein
MVDHPCSDGPWNFPGPRNLAVICCSHVLEGRPILRVTHDEDDESWQILCGQAHVTDDARVVCLGCMIKRDSSLETLADLPLGWCADRDALGTEWERSPNPALEEGSN